MLRRFIAASLCWATVYLVSRPVSAHKTESSITDPFQKALDIAGLSTSKKSTIRSEAIEVICAGSPKTGTTSTEEALKILGHEVYRINEMMNNGQLSYLDRLFVKEDGSHRLMYPWGKGDTERDAIFDELYDAMLDFGATATSDAPLRLFHMELLERSPKAKVILTTHPNGREAWIESFRSTVVAFSAIHSRPFSFLFSHIPWGDSAYKQLQCRAERVWWEPWYLPWVKICWTINFTKADLEGCADHYYEERNDYVRSTVPQGQLLEYNVKQGWEPLCQFLEVPVEDCPSSHNIPFPRVNTRSDNDIAFWVLRLTGIFYPILPLLPVAALWGLVIVCRRVLRCLCTTNQRADHEKKL